MKKLSLILCILLLAGTVFSSCSNGTDKPVAGNTTEAPVSDPADTELSDLDIRSQIADDLPNITFDGREFRLYASKEDNSKCFFADAANGDIVNDAVFKAISTTEERFNVDIVCLYSTGDGNDDVIHNDAIAKSIKTNDNLFDVAENHDSLSGSASIEGQYVNLKELQYLDFTKPWWASNAMESLTYLDQIYLASSAMSYRGFNNTRVLFFNKELLKNYNIEEPYQTVFDGKWTIDRLVELTKDVYEDLNSDGIRDEEDRYGYVANYPIYCYLESYGIPTIIKADDSLTTGVNCEKTVTMIEKIYNLLYETKGGNIFAKDDKEKGAAAMFSKDQSLFTFGEFNDAIQTFRYTEVNYGIIPTPKFDENQENYLAAYTDRFFVVPQTANPDDYDFIGIIMEAMSAEGYKQIYPAYYEVALKQKFTFDNESMQVLDLINECRILDFAYVYCADISGLVNTLLNPTSAPSSNFASLYSKQEKSINSKLKKVYNAFAKLQ